MISHLVVTDQTIKLMHTLDSQTTYLDTVSEVHFFLSSEHLLDFLYVRESPVSTACSLPYREIKPQMAKAGNFFVPIIFK